MPARRSPKMNWRGGHLRPPKLKKEITMLIVTPKLSIPEDELSEEFLRSTGAGGQHVNKTETTVRLRFDAANSPSLTAPIRSRLIKLAGARATPHGEILIE